MQDTLRKTGSNVITVFFQINKCTVVAEWGSSYIYLCILELTSLPLTKIAQGMNTQAYTK